MRIHEKEIAVAGVSCVETKYGYKIFKELVKHDFKVFGINPSGGELFGKKIYRNLREMERVPDLIITVVPPHITESIIEDCRKLGVKEIWMQPGSESDAAIKKARQYGLMVNAHACFLVHAGIWAEPKPRNSAHRHHLKPRRHKKSKPPIGS